MSDSAALAARSASPVPRRPPAVQLVALSKRFGDIVAVNGIDLTIGDGEFFSLLGPSADLGAHGSQTFRYVTFPLVRSALLACGILAFALSFDEIIVTTFTAGSGYETLPQWIFANIARPNNVPLVNVMATVVMVVSIPLAWLARRLSD